MTNNQLNLQGSATRTKHIVTITGGDTYFGHSIASYILRESERDGRDRHHDCRLRVLCKNESNCDQLRELGAEIFETDYEDRDELREAFRDSKYAIFIPEMTKKRVHHGENVMDAMEREDVEHVLMFSVIGAESDEKNHKNLREFYKLEKYLEDSYTKGRWCIFRLDFVQQAFMFWAPMIEDQRVIKLNIGRNGRFAPINMCDVSRATYAALTGQRRDRRDNSQYTAKTISDNKEGFRWIPLDSRHHKKIYKLTGPEIVSGHEIAEIINDTIEDGRDYVRFEPVSWREMKKDLERLRRGGKHRDFDEDDGDRSLNVQVGRPGQTIQNAVAGLQAALANVQIASAGVQAVVGMQQNGNAINVAIFGMQIQTAVVGMQIAVSGVQGIVQNDNRRRNGRRGGRRDEEDRDRNDDERNDRGRGGRHGRNGRHHDGRRRDEKPFPRHLTETKIEFLVELLDFVKSGQADFTSGDLRDFIGEEGESLEEFFKMNRDDFTDGPRYRA